MDPEPPGPGEREYSKGRKPLGRSKRPSLAIGIVSRLDRIHAPMTGVAMSSRLLLLAILIGYPPLTLGCWANDDEARAAARSAQWEALEREHEILVDLRAQLAAARAEEAPEQLRELEAREIGRASCRERVL